MQKIGIVTLFGLYNYGNRLQNYAVQEIFRKYGFQCDTLISSECTPRNILKQIKEIVTHGNLRIIKSYLFNRKYLSIRVQKNHALLFSETINNDYEYFVVGSDQVWNPEIRQNQRKNFFLQFAEKNKRLTLSPSIAVSSIPDEYKQTFSEGFNGFNHISVREINSVPLVEDLTKVPVTHLIDPTLALTRVEWEKIEKAVSLPNNYVVSLFLGNKNNDNLKSILKKYSDEGYHIIDFSKWKWHSMGPDEFIYIIHHSSLVCTDSFHCLVFSILFERPFYAFNRHSGKDSIDVTDNMSSRIDSLLTLFEIPKEIVSGIGNLAMPTIDYKRVNDILISERKRLYDFVELELGY